MEARTFHTAIWYDSDSKSHDDMEEHARTELRRAGSYHDLTLGEPRFYELRPGDEGYGEPPLAFGNNARLLVGEATVIE